MKKLKLAIMSLLALVTVAVTTTITTQQTTVHAAYSTDSLMKDTKGKWYKTKYSWGNYSIDSDYTGLVEYKDNWFYVKNGYVDWKHSGLVRHTNGGWFYVTNGKINWKFTGLYRHNGIWFYVENGQIDWQSNTLVQHNKTWFFVYNGKRFFVKGGKVDWTIKSSTTFSAIKDFTNFEEVKDRLYTALNDYDYYTSAELIELYYRPTTQPGIDFSGNQYHTNGYRNGTVLGVFKIENNGNVFYRVFGYTDMTLQNNKELRVPNIGYKYFDKQLYLGAVRSIIKARGDYLLVK